MLHTVIREHLDLFLREVSDRGDGGGLPRFVEQEFRQFLTCGVLAHGFARVRCEHCTFERLVPFSCKGRGFCPNCGGRRMTERAAHLVDEVLPPVPVRQWVLTLPYRLRYLLAWDHGLSRAVLAVYVRVLLEFYRRQARRRGVPEGRTGALTVTQRFGSALNVNLHFHTIAFDGVFSRSAGVGLEFHPAAPPSDAEVAQVLHTIRRRVRRLLRRRGLEPADEGTGAGDPLAEASMALAGIVGASVQGRVALGPRAGARVRRLGEGLAPSAGSRGPRYWTWAALMRRAFDIDVLRCPHCAGRMRLIATIEDPAVIARILAHLGLSGFRDGPGPAPPSAAAPAEQHALPHPIV